MLQLSERIIGSLLGTAVGDSLGLPYEGISRRRAAKMLGPPSRHRFFFGRGMISDDTEHSILVAQSIIAGGVDEDRFSREMARRLRRWFLSFPAGMGKATARSCIKLCLGISARRSGVFSAGNGPAMRAAILGAAVDDADRLRRLVQISSRITHTDPKAEYAAHAVAVAANISARDVDDKVDAKEFLTRLRNELPCEATELLDLLARAVESVASGRSTVEYAESIGLANGVSGYSYHTVPVVIHAWLAHQGDFKMAVTETILCGGDADTTAAIVGGIVGASVGREGIPEEWLDGICDWPWSVARVERVARQLAESLQSGETSKPVRTFWPCIFARNMLFLAIVLFHGFRRLAPPY